MSVEAVVYRAGDVTEYDDIAAARAARGTTWVRASGAAVGELETFADAFDIHPLSVEDVVNGVRPKTSSPSTPAESRVASRRPTARR
ncbi:MAG: hypothetical protein ABEH77_00200 [Halobacteriaceae archaeon]